jgi:hypothetical protein
VSIDATGSIPYSSSLSFGPNTVAIPVTGFELRAPVRTNDQIVLVDRHITDIDFDGDRINDAADLAMWRVVVGNEAVVLPNRVASLTALRVDSFISIRVIYSSGISSKSATTMQSTWYAPGIGVVRNVLASSDPKRVMDQEDLLTGYDGITSGWGYLYQDKTVQPVGPFQPLTFPIKLPDGALMYAYDMADTPVMVRMDRSGNYLSAKTIPTGVPVSSTMFRLGAGIRYVVRQFPILSIYPVSDDGAFTSTTPATVDLSGRLNQLLSADSLSITAAAGADRIWLAWHRSYFVSPGNVADEIVLRAIDGGGNFVSDEILFPTRAGLYDLQIAANSIGVTLSWKDVDVNGVMWLRYVQVKSSGGVTFDNRLPEPQNWFAGGYEQPRIAPVVDENNLWLLWNGVTDSSFVPPVPHGLRIDGAGNVVGTSADAAGVNAATISPFDSDFTDVNWPLRVATVGGNWFVTGKGFGYMYSEDTTRIPWLTYGEYAPGVGALTGTIREVMKVHVPLPMPQTNIVQPIVFDDRVLLLPDDGIQTLPTVVWRRQP